jgi:hypothetical protein
MQLHIIHDSKQFKVFNNHFVFKAALPFLNSRKTRVYENDNKRSEFHASGR